MIVKPLIISGKEVLPIVEGGKGVRASDYQSSSAMANAGAVGTFSGALSCTVNEHGENVSYIYNATTRRGRHEEMIINSINGIKSQIRAAREISKDGIIHMNILWEMGSTQAILAAALDQLKGEKSIDGITAGAGLPYRLADMASAHKIYYYPIVSSMRAFKILWKRNYHKNKEYLGGVVYEDPWLAGGHNGISNKEDPEKPENPEQRVKELRKFMNEVSLNHVPIVMAGGVWYLRDWSEWIDNPEIAPIAFQLGTRPLLTKESPIPIEWKKRITTLKEGDVSLNKFSPTGFYSSALRNSFIKNLEGRSKRQIEFARKPDEMHAEYLEFGPRKRKIYVSPNDRTSAQQWIQQGFNEMMITPDSTIVFENKQAADKIISDQINCVGCLSHCRFSNWKDHDDHTTGKKPDPRSYCIQKTLITSVESNDAQTTENELIFSGHNAFKFRDDPLLQKFRHSLQEEDLPTMQQLVDCMVMGN